jgi:outer membrane beta-barrel protein
MVPHRLTTSLALFDHSNESTVPKVLRSWGVALALLALASSTAVAEGDDDDGKKPAPAADRLPAAGDQTTAAPPQRPSDAPLPSCLDQTIRDQLGEQLKPRGVQKRDFRKDGKIVLHGHGGLFGGDLTSSSWIAGGSLGFWFTEDLGVQAEFALTPLTLDLDAPINKFFGDNRFDPAMAYLALANVMWSPVHAKLKMGGGIVHSDLMFFVGGGRMFHDAVQGMTFDAGFALDMFVTKVLTIRFDLRDVMAVEEIAGSTHYTNNFVATMGLALWIPSGL